MWGGTSLIERIIEWMDISIHPPRVGWDRGIKFSVDEMDKFQSTHPVWGGTLAVNAAAVTAFISIHPPRVGWDREQILSQRYEQISIHPPRVGWDHD